MNRWLAATLLLVSLAALALRLPSLDRRPMHNDEAVNAIVFQRLWEQGDYRYNPDEYHGPALHYATLPFAWLSGERDFDHLSERTLRWVTVAAGVVLVLAAGLLHDALGARAMILGALLLASSPAMVFYSRYFIHEMLLVAATLLFIGCAWRYTRSPHAGWAIAAGLSLGGMYVTKETFVLSLAGVAIATALAAIWNRRAPAMGRTLPNRFPKARVHMGLCLAAAAIVGLLLFSSFFSHLRGPLDSALTYLPWLRRAGGHSVHLHPWHFYLTRLFWHQPPNGPIWTEGLIGLLAFAGAFATVVSRGGLSAERLCFGRWLMLYTVAMTAIYSVIQYKTPWCLLNFLLPMILLAGLGADTLLGLRFGRVMRGLLAVALTAGFVHLGGQAWRTSQELTTHRGNPYLYAQTVPNVLELAERVKGIAAASPQGVQTEIKVVAAESEYWPLPWYLRQLRTVWWLDRLPGEPYAPIMIVAAGLQAALDEKSNKRWLSVGYYELRPREFFELYVEFGLWKRYLETRPPPREEE